MNTTHEPLDFCLHLSAAHAGLAARLDELLGTFHGLGYEDFLLLTLVARGDGACQPFDVLARTAGKTLSALTRQLAPLEKTGLLRREGAPGKRMVGLLPGGKRILDGATATAAAVAAELVSTLRAPELAAAHATLAQLRARAIPGA